MFICLTKLQLIWNFISLASCHPLRTYIGPVNKNLEKYENYKDIFIPELNRIEQAPLSIDFNDILQATRQRRDVELEDLGIDNVSFEVPTIMRVNDSHNGDVQVNLDPSMARQNGQMMSNPVCNQQMPVVQPKLPIFLTICLENIFPPGKADKYIITNSSELRGTGALLKINFCEVKTTQNPSDLVFSFELSTTANRIDRMEPQSKLKIEQDEDEDGSAQKTLQEILRKILGVRVNSSTLSPEDLPTFNRNFTDEPLTLILNPSMLHKFSNKLDTTTSKWRTTFSSRSPNQPDYEYLSKLVEQISSSIPREKMASLLTGLIAKAYPARE